MNIANLTVQFEYRKLDVNESFKVVQKHTYKSVSACKAYLQSVFNKMSAAEQEATRDDYELTIETIDDSAVEENWKANDETSIVIPIGFEDWKYLHWIDIVVSVNLIELSSDDVSVVFNYKNQSYKNGEFATLYERTFTTFEACRTYLLKQMNEASLIDQVLHREGFNTVYNLLHPRIVEKLNDRFGLPFLNENYTMPTGFFLNDTLHHVDIVFSRKQQLIEH